MITRNVPPSTTLFQSLRGIKYDTGTALAEIINNSIDAKCRNVTIDFQWARSKSWVRIVDDGNGMDDLALEQGMRLGGRDPRPDFHATRMGHFGLGLKTASFSQARRLTVASRKFHENIVCFRWDLDLIDQDELTPWPLFEGAEHGSELLMHPLDKMKNGTIVLWEKIDRIVSDDMTPNEFYELVDGPVRNHLVKEYRNLIKEGVVNFEIIVNGLPVLQTRDNP